MNNLHLLRRRDDFVDELKSFRPKFEEENILDFLASAIKDFRTTLVLGSGVSSSVGLPLWKELLINLVDKLCSELDNSENLAVSLKKMIDNASPAVMARYIENIAITKSGLTENIRECLYTKYDESKESILLTPLVQLLVTPGDAVRISNVLTYNFDNSLERCLKRHGVSYRSIHSAKQYAGKEMGLRIFHPHGFLPHPSDDLDNSFLDDSNIFSERGYNTLFMDIPHWANTLQLHHFTTRRCILVGLSMVDPSMRRLLEFAKNQGNRNEAHHVTVQCAKPDMIFNALFEKDMSSLGVRVLWVEHLERMTGVLQKLQAKLGGTP